MKQTKHLLAGAMLAASLGAHAQSSFIPRLYGELGYASIGIKATDGIDTAKSDPGMLLGTLGYQFMPHLAIEGFAGFGIVKDDVSFNGAGTGVKAKADSTFGVFIRPSVRATDSLELFGRIGWARSKATLSVNGLGASDTDSDVAWGLGLNYHISPASYLQWGWTQLYDKDGVTARGWSLSYGRHF